MDDFYPEIDINQDQAKAIAQGLFTVARADGVIHPAEAALITEFYASAVDHPGDLGALERSPAMAGETLAQILPTKPLREMFLQTALLVAHADGHYGEGEARLIREYAQSFSIAEADLNALHGKVKE